MIKLKADESLDKNCAAEVHQLHDFFANWFLGKIHKSEDGFSRFSSVLSKEFQIVTPNKSELSKDQILNYVYDAHGKWEHHPSNRIWIENIRTKRVSDSLIVVNYEEWQQVGDVVTSRDSLALFRRNERCLNNVEWVSVHETNLQTRVRDNNQVADH